MKFKKVSYRISNRHTGHDDVVGFAVEQNIVPVRIAVRKIARGYWACDHWDTGYRICASSSKVNAALDGLRLVNEKQRIGEYESAIAKAAELGCLRMAGG